MVNVKKLLSISVLGLLLAGCNTTITNLTPKEQLRNHNGFYPVEAAFTSSQQSLLWQSIKPTVIVGKDAYPMQYTSMMTNRWETLIPASAGTRVIYYRYKFNYTANGWGPPKADSKLSPVYRLQILDQ